MFLLEHVSMIVKTVSEIRNLLSCSLFATKHVEVGCLKRVVGCGDVAGRVVSSTLLDVGRLSDLFSVNELLNE